MADSARWRVAGNSGDAAGQRSTGKDTGGLLHT